MAGTGDAFDQNVVVGYIYSLKPATRGGQDPRTLSDPTSRDTAALRGKRSTAVNGLKWRFGRSKRTGRLYLQNCHRQVGRCQGALNLRINRKGDNSLEAGTPSLSMS